MCKIPSLTIAVTVTFFLTHLIYDKLLTWMVMDDQPLVHLISGVMSAVFTVFVAWYGGVDIVWEMSDAIEDRIKLAWRAYAASGRDDRKR